MEPKPSNRTTSKQDYGTPPEFLAAVRRFLGISEFALDVCADVANHASDRWYDEEADGLTQPWALPPGWNWLNPPFNSAGVWARRAALLKREGIKVAMLVPAAIDTIWWRDWVHDRALVIPVSRMAFVGAKDVFPKPLALCLYSPIEPPDYKPLWRWKQDQPGADS